MVRHRRRPPDSLDLLLDTICNTFGGVLFIAILVVILLQFSGKVETHLPSANAGPTDVAILESKRVTLSAQIIQLQNARSTAAKLRTEFSSAEVRELLSNKLEARTRQESLKTDRDRLQELVEAKQSHIDASQKSEQEVRQESKSLQERKSLLEGQIESERKGRTRNARMPLAHGSNLKREVALICRYGRMYVWHKYDTFGNRVGLNTDEFVVTDEQSGALITSPIPSAGIPLTEDSSTQKRLRDKLRAFDVKACYVGVVVRPDSFEEFKVLRDILIEMGFEYRLEPIADGQAFADRGGTARDLQ